MSRLSIFRSKNTVNILSKNLLDVLVGYVVYWAVGWGLSQSVGGTGFSAGSEFFFVGMRSEMYPRFFLEYVWAANAATIVSGAMAERCHLGGYLLYTTIVTGQYQYF